MSKQSKNEKNSYLQTKCGNDSFPDECFVARACECCNRTIPENKFTHENHKPFQTTSQQDQAIQVNFPVLLRSQQKVLKRYATLADINRPFTNKYLTPPPPWSTISTITENQNVSGRPKSLHINGNSLEMATMNNNRNHHRTKSLLIPGHPVDTTPPNTTPISTGLSPNYRTRLGTNMTGGSYDGSDLSISEKFSPGFIYSGQFKAIQHSKWKFGLDQPDSLSTTTKTMCCCCHDGAPTTKQLRHTTTPEGLSWRRLHMSRAKLKATATTSELLSGFAMVAMVELQINEPTTVPEWLFVLFAVCTTILVAVHIFALMISTYILPNIDAISKLDVCELVSESPHERMKGFIELAWAFSTILGLFLFLVEIAILCWVKFWDYSFTAAIAATVIVIPVLIMFVAFAVHFYHSLVVYKYDSSVNDIQNLEDMKKELDQAISPV